MKILVIGDTHMMWSLLNKLINRKRPDMVIIAGDFGYWPSEHGKIYLSPVEKLQGKKGKPFNWYGIKNRLSTGELIPIHWCDGNHEDHWQLQYRESDEIMPGVFYQPRGSTLTLPDGRTILFMGGAHSIDKSVRTLGVDWFPDEVIKYHDFENLPDKKIDIVVSHTCPKQFLPYLGKTDWGKTTDPSVVALGQIFEMYNPKLWYFGHWHIFKTGFTYMTRWYALNHSTRPGHWVWLPD
jgi:hypothetical protein